MRPVLHVVMYHYVRELPSTPFPRIKGMLLGDFHSQVRSFCQRYEMATLESALAFLRGVYEPQRDMCLLTFDDGLKEHYTEVTPFLADLGVQGVFFPITECMEEQSVASVHMNHFLMASLELATYRNAFLKRLREIGWDQDPSSAVDEAAAKRTYRWDTPDVASFKYLFNFVLKSELRDRVVKALFEEYVSEERAFSRELYLSWEEGRAMQEAGMILGGHSHRHRPLSSLEGEELNRDLTACRDLLNARLRPQGQWPFSYPYGKRDSFNDAAAQSLERMDFVCSFSTETGSNHSGAELFAIRRLDCKDAPSN